MHAKSVIRVGFAALFLLALSACASTGKSRVKENATAPRPAVISHIVFIKLVDPSQADACIADCDAMLATVPGVVSYACGKHLDTGRGESVNDDYDVAIYLGFDSREALDGYVAHANHVAAVNKWKSRMEWIRVQDFADERAE